jgi:hypothetical protein
MLAKLYLPETLAYYVQITERGEPDRNALKVRRRFETMTLRS